MVVRGSILVIRWLTRAGGRILAVQHCPSEGYVNRSTVSVDCFGQHALVGICTADGGGGYLFPAVAHSILYDNSYALTV